MCSIVDAANVHLMATLNNPAPAEQDGFGNSVAVSGDTVVVGVVKDDPGGVTGAGAAYVFDTTGALLSVLGNPAPAIKDAFGSGVAVSGNVAVVGASMDIPAGGVKDAGAAYTFANPGGSGFCANPSGVQRGRTP
jgi:FG-GAP repeat